MSPRLLALPVGVREVSSHSDATTDQKDLESKMFRKSHSYYNSLDLWVHLDDVCFTWEL